MRKFFAAIAFASLIAAPALAADLPLKAPPKVQSAFITGSGWYVGLGGFASVAASSVSGTNFPSLSSTNLMAAGGALSGDVGYIWGNCFLSSWCQAELDVKWQNVSGTVSQGSVSSEWAVSGEFDVGAQVIDSITTFLPSLPTASWFPTFNPSGLLPANLSGQIAATPRQYLGVKVEGFKLDGTFGSANGERWGVAVGPVTGYRWQTLNSAGVPNGGSLNVGVEILFANRGVTLGNVFATNGAPITINSSANMNTLYNAFVKYDFGVGR